MLAAPVFLGVRPCALPVGFCRLAIKRASAALVLAAPLLLCIGPSVLPVSRSHTTVKRASNILVLAAPLFLIVRPAVAPVFDSIVAIESTPNILLLAAPRLLAVRPALFTILGTSRAVILRVFALADDAKVVGRQGILPCPVQDHAQPRFSVLLRLGAGGDCRQVVRGRLIAAQGDPVVPLPPAARGVPLATEPDGVLRPPVRQLARCRGSLHSVLQQTLVTLCARHWQPPVHAAELAGLRGGAEAGEDVRSVTQARRHLGCSGPLAATPARVCVLP
mmetsp:Transcript_79252/g.224143  ORF Transcript_79252/g.224143 Transcript_79252/m.224143 type:complete len:277 (-) Transcript_79252:108-938(-)